MKTSIASLILAALALSSLTACSTQEDLTYVNKQQVSDVIGVTQAHLNASYWQKTQDLQSVMLQQSEISHFNQQLFDHNRYVVDPLATADQFTQQQIVDLINKISAVPKSKRFYADGTLLEQKHFDGYLANANIEQVKETYKTKWGLAVERSVLRTFPTYDRVFNSGMDTDLDRFQESGIFPGEAVAIIHESADQQWLLVRSYNYLAWVPKKAIAVGSKEEITRFMKTDDFIVVTGDKVFTNYIPNDSKISQLQLDMGVKLPVVKAEELAGELHGQNPVASHVVKLPTRNDQGQLVFSLALIAKSQDIHIGYLPFTKANIINQAFKFLGERYGWGHDYNARDCTGFVGEIYKTFGILMPRNSGWQGTSDYGLNVHFSKQATHQEKLTALSQLQVGDLIYIPGHVAMFLGYEQGKPYIIHDVKGMSYFDDNNKYYRGTLNGVSVTPLLPLHTSKNTSYVDKIYNIKRISID